MRAISSELEVLLTISEHELKQLEREGELQTILDFRARESSRNKSIPLKLKYTPGESEQIDVQNFPENVYFGNSDKIVISLQNYLYMQLNENKYCCDRFGIGGKVEIMIKRAEDFDKVEI